MGPRAVPQGQHQPLRAAPAEAVQVPPLQHPGLPRQTAAGHVIQKIGMSVQYCQVKNPFRPLCGALFSPSIARRTGGGKGNFAPEADPPT